MKKAVALIDLMNELLAHELRAIHRYAMYAEACSDRKDSFLHSISTLRSIQGMENAERLIEEIVFLEGEPQITSFVPLSFAPTAEDMQKTLSFVEQATVEKYRRTIQLAGESGEERTKDILETLLEKEQKYLAWLQKTEPAVISAERTVSSPLSGERSSPC